MPHIVVKLWPGPTEEQKRLFAERIVAEAVRTLKIGEESFSVADLP